MKIKKYFMLLVSIVGLVLTMLAEDRVVTVYSGPDKLAMFLTSNISKMVIEEESSITPVNEIGEAISVIKVWGVPHATAIFSINPVEFLKNCSVEDGTIKAELNGLQPCSPDIYDGDIVTVNRQKGIVLVHFAAPKKAQTGYVTLSIGSGDAMESATLEVVMQPAFQFCSFYGATAGPDISAMPYLNGRPPLGTLTMYIANRCNKVIDINSEDEVRVAMNIEGGTEENILEAVKCYKWKRTKGEALIVTRDDYEIVPFHGFDAVLGVRSGMETGNVVFECETPCVTVEDPDKTLTLTLNYSVVNIKKDYPIKEITVDNDNVEMDMNATHTVKMSVSPLASYAYQKVAVKVADPTIVEALAFEGYDLPIKALKPGTTTLTFSAYNDTELVTKTMTVTVKDRIDRIVIDHNVGETYIFAGSTTTWTAKVYTVSGVLMNDVLLTWSSRNEDIATVSRGIVTGISDGMTSITAASKDVVSGGRSIIVRTAPATISDASGFVGFYELDSDLVFEDADRGWLVIKDGFVDGEYVGSYNLNDSYYTREDAKAPATGTVTITKGSGEYEYIVTMNVNVIISASKKIVFTFRNGIVEFLPE